MPEVEPEARQRVVDLEEGLAALADPERAEAMAAYMKDHFAFHGVTAAERRKVQRAVLGDWREPEPDDVVAFALACWEVDERELQYAACDVLRRHAPVLRAGDLDAVESLISRRSWWDTVDALAAHVVGPMVTAHPSLRIELDRWLGSGDLWLERAVILHQLRYRDRTDESYLFTACLAHASSAEFFHRKAIGWALREYAKTDPDAVRTFVAEHEDELSGLSRREALKHL
ncbi:MAG: DNA alkylation repair protein [Actinomycetota bacterium]